MEDTKTFAMLVIKDDIIRYEKYFFGGNEDTLFSSNSMGKSFVSALMGIAVSEGYEWFFHAHFDGTLGYEGYL